MVVGVRVTLYLSAGLPQASFSIDALRIGILSPIAAFAAFRKGGQ